MHIGIIGLGRMGLNMAKRLIKDGHKVSAYNRSKEGRAEVATLGAQTPDSIEELVGLLKSPRVVWMMVPHGVVTNVVSNFQGFLKQGYNNRRRVIRILPTRSRELGT